MATTTQSSGIEDFEPCALCPIKHHRDRPSFCQCKHCSIPLCVDCLKEHHEELLQDVAQISHQYNELQQLVQTKQTMIVDETTKSIEETNRYFESYINELRETRRKIIAEMERAKQHAREYVRKLDADLRSVGDEIQGLAKESIVQMTKMKTVSAELKKIEQQLNTYQITRTKNLINTQPEISIKFNCSSDEIEIPRSTEMKVNETCEIVLEEPSLKINTLNMPRPPVVVREHRNNQLRKNNFHRNDDNLPSPNSDENDPGQNFIDTSYIIDCMASDGVNILYTSYYAERPDLIAYCLMDNYDGDADEYRDWKQSRIVDMIWWSSIGKFVCATKNAVYIVDHTNRRFKIASVIRGNWSYVRVAANTKQLFVWEDSAEDDFTGIRVYSTEFECIRMIHFNPNGTGSFVGKSFSFCATNSLIASICTRLQNNRQVVQVTFCNLKTNKIHSVLLGRCNDDIEIRTDGYDRFFITTGHRRFYIVSSNGEKQTINLQNQASRIAVFGGRRVAVSDQPTSMEILTY